MACRKPAERQTLMLFDPEALENKRRYLDAVLQDPEWVRRVVDRQLGKDSRIEPLARTWEPGGGATLFRIESERGCFFLKAKHESVWVESRLESEGQYLRVPSLANEHRLLKEIEQDWVPSICFFDHDGPFQFLALEWLDPFSSVMESLDASVLLRIWSDLEGAVRFLEERGLVHTDLHEHNLCLRGEQIVLVDFEEARPLAQDLPFEDSLDVVGRNRYGDVGEFPPVAGAVTGRTCLERLRRVFDALLVPRVAELVRQCRFDRDCPYNLDELQQDDSRIYQSVSCAGLEIEGQRPADDRRLRLIAFLFARLRVKVPAIRHLDVGCNLGAFCLAAARLRGVESSVGVDASEDFIAAARGLAFLDRAGGVSFRRVRCGDERLDEGLGPVHVVTMFSVYHHIRQKDAFLEDLRRMAPVWLIAEFAAQDRFYPERGSLAAELEHVRRVAGFAHASTIAHSPDYGRPIVVFSNERLDRVTRVGSRVMVRTAKELARAGLSRMRRGARRATRGLREAARGLRSRSGSGPARAIEWLRANELPTGGIRVHSGHEAAYQEVTGYLIPTLIEFGERDFAIRCARWLAGVQRSDGAFCDPDAGKPYVFDTGQALRGLVAASDLLPEARAAARRAAEFLCGQLVDEGRRGFPAAYADLDHVPESIQLYAIAPLLTASKLLGEERFVHCAQNATDYYLRHADLLNVRGSLTHFLAYEIEALIEMGHAERAAEALDALAGMQRADGSVRGIGSGTWVCSPGLAQLAVCWLETGRFEPAERALGWLARHQEPSGGWRGSYGRGAWYFPEVEPAWTVKYYLDAHRLRVARHFDRAAASFPASVAPGDGRLRAILSAIGPGDRVLEAGCGKGRFLAAVRESRPGTRCTGVDLSPGLLAHVPQGIERVVGSIENLPCPPDEFDTVFAVEVVEHSANPAAAVRELVRVVRPGGRVLVIDKQRAHWGRMTTESWERWPHRNAVAGWLAEGCADVRVEPVPYDDRPADGLMLVWSGTKCPSVSG